MEMWAWGTSSATSKMTILGTSTSASIVPSDAIVDIKGTSTAHLLMGVANTSPFWCLDKY